MSKATERKTVFTVDGSVITRANIIEGGKAIEVFSVSSHVYAQEKALHEEFVERYFPLVRASSLSLEDEFLNYEPASDKQTRFKSRLITAIESGLHDFRAQRMDPSIKDDMIFYQEGMKPGIGKDYLWWKEAAKNFMPEEGSRLGTWAERTAFLGLLIQYLVEVEGCTKAGAWHSVCDDSAGLGCYQDSIPSSHGLFEETGCRSVGGWCDLGNTHKITTNYNESVFYREGGSCKDFGHQTPLTNLDCVHYTYLEASYSTGWIVLAK